MASPEKALADLVFKSCKNMDKDQIKQELLESKRIDRECFYQLDKALLLKIAEAYHSKSVNYLIDLIGVI